MFNENDEVIYSNTGNTYRVVKILEGGKIGVYRQNANGDVGAYLRVDAAKCRIANPTNAAVQAVQSARGPVSRRLIAAAALRMGQPASMIARSVDVPRAGDGLAEHEALQARTAALAEAIETVGREALAKALESEHMEGKAFDGELVDTFELHGYAEWTIGGFSNRVRPMRLKRGTLAECYREWSRLEDRQDWIDGQFDIIPADYFPSDLQLQASRDYQTRPTRF